MNETQQLEAKIKYSLENVELHLSKQNYEKMHINLKTALRAATKLYEQQREIELKKQKKIELKKHKKD